MAAPVDEMLKFFAVDTLKEEQKQIFDCLSIGRDCFAVLPTGFGKSLPYQLFALAIKLKSEAENPNIDPSKKPKVLLCSPLISLMKDQVKKLASITNLKAGYKGESADVDNQIREGHVDLIYTSPEGLVGDQEWRMVFQMLEVKLIVVDKFHTIYTWGMQSDSKKDVFMSWFASVGEVRSFYPEASLLALSATCTLKMQKKVMKVLIFNNPKTIIHSPGKPNIKLIVQGVPNSVEMAFTWLIGGITHFRDDFPKCLIYCNTIKDSSIVYQYDRDSITECPFFECFTAMFHSESSDNNKDTIISSLGDRESKLKLVIATRALGMGVDIQGFHSLIIYGPPQSAVELVQEIGRIGRDMMQSVAVILFNSYNARFVESDIKKGFTDYKM